MVDPFPEPGSDIDVTYIQPTIVMYPTARNSVDSRIFPSEYNQSEMSIAISPVDPDKILVGANTFIQTNTGNNFYQGYYYSQDGGTNWSGDDVLPGINNLSADPVVAYDIEGNADFHYISRNPLSRKKPFLKKSTDGGVTWQNLVGSTTRTKYFLAVSKDMGKILYTTSNYMYRSLDEGLTFTAIGSNRNWRGIAVNWDMSKIIGNVYYNYHYLSINGGSSWTRLASPKTYWWALAATPDFSRFTSAATNLKYFYQSSNYGNQWNYFGNMALTSAYDGYGADTRKCPAGYNALAKQSTCTICPGGTYSVFGNTQCNTCAFGKFSYPGSASCENCPAGTFSTTGYSQCTPCSPGYYSMEQSSICTVVSAGYWPTKTTTLAEFNNSHDVSLG